MVNKTCYRAGIVFDEPEERTRPNPLAVIYQSGKNALNSPIPQENKTQKHFLDRFFEYGGKPVVPGSQPIRNPQQQAQPAVKRAPQVRRNAPIHISPPRAKEIREMRARQSNIPAIKHRIKVKETQNLLQELVRVSTASIR